jgi:methionyl-tRNA synthetase
MTTETARVGETSASLPTARYYLTTAIDYPNGKPHIGHALEKVAADVAARYHRLRGHDTYFSMGIDVNSLHVLTAAQAANVDPYTWIDTMDEAFRLAWSTLDVSYDYWIRTNEERHARASQELFSRSLENGDIYKASYSGWYCPNCNNYYTAEELVAGRCPIHPTIFPLWLNEENYFFALSKYQEQLLAHIEAHPDFIVPASRKAEVVGLLRQGLRDFSVSRQVRPGMEGWGIPVPGDPQQVIYVWFDALINYVTAVGFPDDSQKFARYWPADAHVIGKDITRFHCLYWPAMLLSAKLALPEQIAVHGFITIEGNRVSKTLGNGIDPVALVHSVGVDAVRFALLRNLSFTSDGDFSRTGLLRAYNDELANDLGNLLNRVVSMVERYRSRKIPTPGIYGPLEENLRSVLDDVLQRSAILLENWEIGNALNAIWSLVKRTNQYIEQCEPWKLARQADQAERLDTVLYCATETTRILSILLAPYIPSSANRMCEQLDLPSIKAGDWDQHIAWGSQPLNHVVPGKLLFPRLDANVIKAL